jgi:hypothetical protein
MIQGRDESQIWRGQNLETTTTKYRGLNSDHFDEQSQLAAELVSTVVTSHLLNAEARS